MIDAERILRETYPDIQLGKDQVLAVKALKKLLRADDFLDIRRKNQHLRGYAFLDKLLRQSKFGYRNDADFYDYIPAQGRLIIVANQTLGTLDSLALLKLVRCVRPDARLVAQRVPSQLQSLQSLFLSVDFQGDKQQFKSSYQALVEALEGDQAIILFPAGDVSRITRKGVRDGEWQDVFLRLAVKTQSPVLPVRIKAENAVFFYNMPTLYKPLGTLLFIKEQLRNEPSARFHIGAPVGYQVFVDSHLHMRELCKQFRKHVLSLGKKRAAPLFPGLQDDSIEHRRAALRAMIQMLPKLGDTPDGKQIYEYRYVEASPLMQEIRRLRKLTRRTVEEGETVAAERYDQHHLHIVLWDERDAEIVGAYRVAEGASIVSSLGLYGFYTQSLFEIQPAFERFLPYCLELADGFVQPRYWNVCSLDYLWYGLGAFLRRRPGIKYLFTPFTLGRGYSELARELIVGFYQQQFAPPFTLVHARQPFELSDHYRQFAQQVFRDSYAVSLKVLNGELKKSGVKTPSRYKHTLELFEGQGCYFLGFGRDEERNSIDGLMLLELEKIAPRKRQRFFAAEQPSVPGED
jgi:putative hemolysin